jgi:hypothetical protein
MHLVIEENRMKFYFLNFAIKAVKRDIFCLYLDFYNQIYQYSQSFKGAI